MINIESVHVVKGGPKTKPPSFFKFLLPLPKYWSTYCSFGTKSLGNTCRNSVERTSYSYSSNVSAKLPNWISNKTLRYTRLTIVIALWSTRKRSHIVVLSLNGYLWSRLVEILHRSDSSVCIDFRVGQCTLQVANKRFDPDHRTSSPGWVHCGSKIRQC